MRGIRDKLAGVGGVLTTALLVAALLIPTATPVAAAETDEAQGIVDNSRVTVSTFMRDKNYSWLQRNLKKAKGVLIYPQVLKAGFILGGSGGTGILLVRDQKTGNWSEPAFYTVGSVSFGLQIGGEAAEVMVLVMSQKAIDSLFASSVKLGGDTSIAVGPYGAGAKGDITTDFVSFAKTKGIYAGINLEGSVVGVRDSLNKAYYGKDVRPVEIIVEKKASNKGSAALRAALKSAAK